MSRQFRQFSSSSFIHYGLNDFRSPGNRPVKNAKTNERGIIDYPRPTCFHCWNHAVNTLKLNLWIFGETGWWVSGWNRNWKWRLLLCDFLTHVMAYFVPHAWYRNPWLLNGLRWDAFQCHAEWGGFDILSSHLPCVQPVVSASIEVETLRGNTNPGLFQSCIIVHLVGFLRPVCSGLPYWMYLHLEQFISKVFREFAWEARRCLYIYVLRTYRVWPDQPGTAWSWHANHYCLEVLGMW